jgi:sugar/nucleoside kinase (ribokinase family)
MKAVDVVAAGELFTDLIMTGFDFWPEPGREAFANGFHREIGGGAAITACGLARLGIHIRALGVVGTDGDWLINELATRGVDTSTVRIDSSEATAFTVVATSPADRAYLTYPGANRGFPATLLEAARAKEFSGARHVHLAYPPALATASEPFAAIHENGCTISLDAGWHEEWLADPCLLTILPLVDIYFPNEAEAERITGESAPREMLRRFREQGVRRVALKLGPAGAGLLWDGEILWSGPRQVATVDTTGAGDCFDAGFLYAWLKGNSPEICLRTANVCGALSTEAYGGIEGFPNPKRLAEELEL